LLNAGVDGMLLIAFSVVAIVVGRPLSYLNCQVIGSNSVAESAAQLNAELKQSLHENGGHVVYSNWIGASRTVCYEMKAIWGLSIALWYVISLSDLLALWLTTASILFCFSVLSSVCLWRRSKTVPPKDMA